MLTRQQVQRQVSLEDSDWHFYSQDNFNDSGLVLFVSHVSVSSKTNQTWLYKDTQFQKSHQYSVREREALIESAIERCPDIHLMDGQVYPRVSMKKTPRVHSCPSLNILCHDHFICSYNGPVYPHMHPSSMEFILFRYWWIYQFQLRSPFNLLRPSWGHARHQLTYTTACSQ